MTTTSQTHQEKKGEKSNKQNQKRKWRNHNGQHRNTKVHKRLPSATICQKKMDKLEEMDKFLEKYNFPKLNQEEIENLNRPITSTEINCTQNYSSKQKPAPDGFTAEFYQKF